MYNYIYIKGHHINRHKPVTNKARDLWFVPF